MNTAVLEANRTDRRYQVFISSTFSGLDDERKGAIEAVFEEGHIPIALDRFNPSNTNDLHVIEQAMKDSQIYILILGPRYGELVPGRNISFTEFEYDLSQKYNLITLVFRLHPDDIARLRTGFLNSTDPRELKDAANSERLELFLERLKAHSGRPFREKEPGFKHVVARALQKTILAKLEEEKAAARENKPPLPAERLRGFIREPETTELLEVANNPFIIDLVKELRGFEKLYDRTQIQRDKKERVSQFFMEEYVNSIIIDKVGLFFESGSTVAYLAKALSQWKPFAEAVKLNERREPSIQLSTNNVLVYMLFWLNTKIPCTAFPWSPPSENTYGASYGGVESLTPLSPNYAQPPLDRYAEREISRLRNTPYTLESMKERGPALLLGAVSGLQINENHRSIFRSGLSEDSRKKIELQVRQCFGPHVGSYHNKVFKRFMYSTGVPIMIFLTDDKVDLAIETEKCHFVLDREYSWEKFYKEYPLAFCVACERERVDEYAAMFKNLGFQIKVENNALSPILSFIAKNSVFIEKFESRLSNYDLEA